MKANGETMVPRADVASETAATEVFLRSWKPNRSAGRAIGFCISSLCDDVAGAVVLGGRVVDATAYSAVAALALNGGDLPAAVMTAYMPELGSAHAAGPTDLRQLVAA
jgi:hypothetical protein